MLTQKEIINYHLSETKDNIRGFEFEIFCLNDRYQRLFFNKDKTTELQDVFNYLINKKDFKLLGAGKTIGVERDSAKFTLEPGSQLEYSAKCNQNTNMLVKEFLELLEIYKIFGEKLDLRLTDISMFPLNDVKDVPLLSAARYEIMDKYFQDTGTLGRVMMRNTASLQLTFSYEDREDLEKKVNRLLFLKPVLLILSSNSRIYKGNDSKYYSFREMVWKDTDPKRCGDPGENFWTGGKWTIENYIEKVLDAPVIFDTAKKQYQTAPTQPFRNLMSSIDLESYIFHNSTVFTDIRIKNYIEMRYLDNPTILLVPGIMLLIESILSNDNIWRLFNESLPYKFEEVPTMTQKLNVINKESLKLWNKNIKPVLVEVINNLKLNCPKKSCFYFDALIEKTNSIGNPTNLEINSQNILERSANQFNNNLAGILAYNKII